MALISEYGAQLLAVLTICLSHVCEIRAENYTMEVYLTKPNPTEPDTYIFEAESLPADKTYYIVGYEPTVTMDIVHHMIVMGCENIEQNGDKKACDGDSTYMYAWAKNAPPLYLPTGVGFKIGKDGYKGVSLQLHFANVDNLEGKNMDQLGVKLLYTDVPQPKVAGVYLIGAGGGTIQPNQKETFDAECRMHDDVHMHIFAFRPHTHHLGKVVAGYQGVPDNDGKIDWTLIGKQDPQKPQMFYPVKEVVIEKGDILAARCTMFNFKDHPVSIGGTSHDEMCNFYAMYWVDDGNFPQRTGCFSEGPPGYRWETDPLLTNVPEDSESLDNNIVA